MKALTSVRIACRSHGDAKELALRLEADGYRVARRWKLVVARVETPEDAEQLARRLHVDATAGGMLGGGVEALSTRIAGDLGGAGVA